MPGIHFHRSNRLETLAIALVDATRAPLRSVLTPEIVVVQSLGMRRWLQQALAAQTGLAMNVAFPFPAAFTDDVLRAAVPDAPRASAFSRHVLPWRVLALFPRVLAARGFEELRAYTAGEPRALKEFQLAHKIAGTFDRYLAYRPQMLLEWQAGRESHWQAQLWRELIRGHEDTNPPALFRRLAAQLRAAGSVRESCASSVSAFSKTSSAQDSRTDPGLPERVSVFGISSLPPIYIELLGALADVIEVHLFLLEPTGDYWADLVSPRERDREARRRKVRALPEDEEPELTGNTLLASLCKTGRDFAWLLLDRLDMHSDDDRFVAPEERTLLGQLQADIFRLRERSSRMGEEAPISQQLELCLAANVPGSVLESCAENVSQKSTAPAAQDSRTDPAADHSLQVHCCHGPMRELEVLHDQLLALFAAAPGLAPRDILVTMPDVETYAPFIDAVFGAPESEAVRIPYTIADRAARAESGVADAFLRLLALIGSRFAAPEVLSLLEAPSVRARFDLAEADLPIIRAWIERTAIRWGIDAEHRAEFDLPPFEQNSWRAGLDRLLLGYALPGDGGTLFAGVLPEPDIEGGLAIVLGAFVDFAERLFRHAAALAAPRPPALWERALRAALDDFFSADDDHADEVRRVSAALESFAHHSAEAHFDAALDFTAVRAHLTAALGDTEDSPGFLAGRVTFCALKPMRSIPFRVICLLGLDDIAFPRHERSPAFDLVAQRPRRGDRTLREDDRYLFLETLLSARDTLYLSYAGLSVRDNTESPPSVLVSELLDYLARHFALPSDFVVKHRLQPFSHAYFDGAHSRLFSYSAENAAAAQVGAAAREGEKPFTCDSLTAPGPEWREVTLDQLADFLAHPAKFFLRQRLGLRLPGEEAPLADAEPEALEGLEKHHVRAALAERSITESALAANLPAARATGALPPGYAGDSAYGVIGREVDGLLTRIGPALAEAVLPPLAFECSSSFSSKSADFGLKPEPHSYTLSGTLTDVRPSALVRYRAAKLRARDRMRAWVAHLALQLAAPAGHPRVTIFHSTDATLRFRPVPDADAELTKLLLLYARGLCAPLPFFPQASWEFAAHNGSAKTDPLQCARRVWLGGEFQRGESEDGWFRLAFRGLDDPLDATFQELARAILEPLHDALEETK